MRSGRLAVAAGLLGLSAIVTAQAREPAPTRLDASARFVEQASPIRVGDVLVFEITITGESARDARLVAEPDFGRLEPHGMVVRTTDGASITIRYELQPFDTGRFVVPPVEIASADAHASTAEAAIELASTASAKDVAADAKIVLPSTSNEALARVVLVSFGVVALGYRIARRVSGRPVPDELALLRSLARAAARRTLGVAAPLPVPVSTVSIERAALAEIDAFARVTADEYDAVAAHAALARVATTFVEGVLRLRSRERTTREILRVASTRFSANGAADLALVLEACDRVKFAQSRPDVERFREMTAALRRMVRTPKGE